MPLRKPSTGIPSWDLSTEALEGRLRRNARSMILQSELSVLGGKFQRNSSAELPSPAGTGAPARRRNGNPEGRRTKPGNGGGGGRRPARRIIGKTKCDEIKNEMRPSWRKAWSKRNATKISHTRKNTVRTTTKRCSNGIFLSQKQRSLRSLLVIANHPLLLSTTTRFRGTDGPLDAVDDPPVALGVSVDHIERKHRQHKLSLHCLE